MYSVKKAMAKRMLKKNAKEIQSVVRKTYKDFSRDLEKRLSGLKIPVKVTITRS